MLTGWYWWSMRFQIMSCYKGLPWTSKVLGGHIKWIRAYGFRRQQFVVVCCEVVRAVIFNLTAQVKDIHRLIWHSVLVQSSSLWFGFSQQGILTTTLSLPQQLWVFPGFPQGCTSVFLQVHSTLPLSFPDKHYISSWSDRMVWRCFFQIDKMKLPLVCLIVLYCACSEKITKWSGMHLSWAHIFILIWPHQLFVLVAVFGP